jgi:phosphoglycolate phosphatase
MAPVVAGGRAFDVDAVVFDKDDTLVSLNATWGPVARTWIGTLAGDDNDVAELLADRLGYDALAGRVVPDSIMATHTLPEIGAHTMTLLLDRGWGRSQVTARIAAAQLAIETDVYGLPLEPLADLVTLFTELRDAGIGIGIFTSDNAQPTQHFLDSTGLTAFVGVIVTGEQLDRPKPHGEGLVLAAAVLGTSPDRVLMVGDSLHDLHAARDAGAAFVAVGHASAAAATADASVAHVGEITVTANA